MSDASMRLILMRLRYCVVRQIAERLRGGGVVSLPDTRDHWACLVFQRPRLRLVELAEPLAFVDRSHEKVDIVVFNLVSRADNAVALVV